MVADRPRKPAPGRSAANLLEAELKRKGVTYAQLVDKLVAIGVDEKSLNIRNSSLGADSRLSPAMSDSNRRERFAHFLRGYWSAHPLSWWDINRVILSVTLQIIAVYFLAGFGLSIWSGYDAKREAYLQEKQRSEAEQYQASRNIAGECAVPNAPVDIVTECLTAQVEAYENRRNTNQDLQAQQDMAYWALWMFVASAAGLFVSVAGLILLLRSLRQTEMAISTDREVGHAQVRAYLTIEPKSPSDLVVGKKAKSSLHIKNTGQSPAYQVRYIAGVLIEDHPLMPEGGALIYPHPSQPPRIGNTVAAQGDFFAEGFSQMPLEKEELRAAMGGGDKRFYLSCIVYYKDVFGVDRETMMTAYLDQVGEPVTDAETGRTGRKFAWMIAHTHNHAT